LGANGEQRRCRFPGELQGDERVLLLPAPLPSNWINKILLASQADKKALESRVQDYANVPLNDFKLQVLTKKQFPVVASGDWPPVDLAMPEHPVSLAAPWAAGAMQGMLANLAGRGQMSAQLSELAFEGHLDEPEQLEHPMLAALGEWLARGVAPQTGDVSQQLFWGTVDAVLTRQASVDPRDAVLAHLEVTSSTLEERLRRGFARLIQDLRALAGLPESGVDELFERHPKSFPRALILFFLRQRCSELLAYQHSALREPDILAAALLFAAREGWLGLPLALRQLPGLSAAVSQRMAAMAQSLAGSDLQLGTPPPRPRDFKELFSPGPKGWSKAQADAALTLTRGMKWPGIRTRIKLTKGDYQLLVGSGGVEILLEGEARAVLSEVEPEGFLQRLADAEIPTKLEQQIRQRLRG